MCGEVFFEDGGVCVGVGVCVLVVLCGGDVVFGCVMCVFEKVVYVEIVVVNGRVLRGGDFAGVVRR